ncbi:hypothetical protein ACFVAV_18345 [Nocardia sp. NPDC057663]|uniref:hypothetical protein n=1 Tax=Nocardia sp. NPDC057663 TaxID=3346201 RepID=UPI00366F2393
MGSAMVHLLNLMEDRELYTIVEQLPVIDEHYGARLVGCLPIIVGSQLPAMLSAMPQDLPGEVQHQIERLLDRKPGVNSGWPDLMRSLATGTATT